MRYMLAFFVALIVFTIITAVMRTDIPLAPIAVPCKCPEYDEDGPTINLYGVCQVQPANQGGNYVHHN